jgi:methionyl-tRNA formyltransferase
MIKLVFMGTAELAAAVLQALTGVPTLQVLAAVSQPDKPRGRGQVPAPTPVKAAAVAAGLPVLQPARPREEAFLEQIRSLHPDLIAVAAYGQILPQTLLDLPAFGCLNVHTSLLPKYRGAAPIQWAILNGDAETGVTIMKMDAGLDTGPVVSQVTTAIADTDTSQTLHDRLAELGGRLLVDTIPPYVAGKLPPQPQPSEGVSYARKILKEDGCLDWSLPARVLWLKVRGFFPWPGAFTTIGDAGQARLLKIRAAAVESETAGNPGTVLRADRNGLVVGCGQQSLRLLEVQREGGRAMSAAQFLAGHPISPGQRLGG